MGKMFHRTSRRLHVKTQVTQSQGMHTHNLVELRHVPYTCPQGTLQHVYVDCSLGSPLKLQHTRSEQLRKTV